MKKLLSIVLALSLCLTAMMGCFVVSADAANKVTVETVTIKTGTATKDVKVTFDFEDTFAASQFTVNFGDLKLTGISAPEGVAIDHNATADGTEDDFSVLNGSINCILDAKGDATLGAFNDVVVTFTFDTADLTANTYAITFTGDVASAGTYDAQTGWTGNETMLAYTAEPGAIVVEEAVVEPECDHANATKELDDEKTDVETQFVYDYYCSDCGSEWEDVVAVGTDLSGTILTANGDISRNISPTNDISMSFRFKAEKLTDYSDFVAFVTKQHYNAGETDYTLKEYFLTDADTSVAAGYYAFKFADVAAYQMTSDVVCALYGYDDTTNTMVKIETTTFSVEFYILTLLKAYASDSMPANIKLLRTALVDLLNYGARAQKLNSFNLNNLANADLGDYASFGTPESAYVSDSTVWAPIADPIGDLEGATDENRIKVSRAVNPEEKVKMRFTFDTCNGDINNYYAKFDYYDVTGTPVESKYFSYSEIGYDNGLSKGFIFGDAVIPTLDYPVTATFYYGDPENGGVAVYSTVFSIELYVKSYYKYNQTEQLTNLSNFVKSLHAYGKSLAAALGTPAYQG